MPIGLPLRKDVPTNETWICKIYLKVMMIFITL